MPFETLGACGAVGNDESSPWGAMSGTAPSTAHGRMLGISIEGPRLLALQEVHCRGVIGPSLASKGGAGRGLERSMGGGWWAA